MLTLVIFSSKFLLLVLKTVKCFLGSYFFDNHKYNIITLDILSLSQMTAKVSLVRLTG